MKTQRVDKVDSAELFKALGDETRLKILRCLFQGEKCVSDLMSELDLAQSHVSHHLKILKVSGIIQSRRDGHKINYFLSPGVSSKIDKHNETLDLGCCEVNFK